MSDFIADVVELVMSVALLLGVFSACILLVYSAYILVSGGLR